MSQDTKQVLLRVPQAQFEALESLVEQRKLKNVQALIYRLIEKELDLSNT